MSTIAPGTLDLFVPGIPATQGSVRAFNNHVIHTNGRDLGAWRAAIATAAYDQWGGQPLLDEPVGLVMAFHLPRPKSIPKRRVFPDRKPDLDKLVRAVLDGLSGVVLTDDARVVTITARKTYATASAGLYLRMAPCRDLVVPAP